MKLSFISESEHKSKHYYTCTHVQSVPYIVKKFQPKKSLEILQNLPQGDGVSRYNTVEFHVYVFSK